MPENKFRAYLRSRAPSDAVRTFVDNAVTDDHLPDAKTWEELENYLKQHQAPPRVLLAAEHVWKQYVNASGTEGREASRRRDRRR